MADDKETISIDGTEFAVADLSEDARNHIANLRICDRRLQELQTDIAITRTARAAYAAALKAALPGAGTAAAEPRPEVSDVAEAVGAEGQEGA